ncbi:MAG: thioredoxin domain-containing protein [Gemmatimonadetes bacterium]|nr:thioredoxin domain-containing protein [Gemmatimonadota bacterium]MBT7862337.1 thioredoxin domain-containing protein [Gemmatimonadota bacterium]
MRVDRLCESWDLTIRVTHYPLHLETPDEGQSLEQLFAGRGVDIEQMQEQMAERMRAEGLEYGDRRMTYNSRRAQQLASWAVTRDGGEAIHQALFVAYFVEDSNLADVDRLVEVAASVGLDTDAARRALRDPRYRAAVSADWERSRQLGVTGVPTFRAGGRAVVGAQPYEVLEQLVQMAGAVRR